MLDKATMETLQDALQEAPQEIDGAFTRFEFQQAAGIGRASAQERLSRLEKAGVITRVKLRLRRGDGQWGIVPAFVLVKGR